MNETLKTIQQRYSCRSYKDQMPEAEKLDAIAAAAVQSPSGMNVQPWQIILVKDRQLMAEFESEAMKLLASMKDKSSYERIMSRGGKCYYNAPCMFVVAVNPAASPYAGVDTGIVVQNIALAAQSQGLGSVICAMVRIPLGGEKGAELEKRLQFPQGYEFGCAVLVGYEENKGTPHQPDLKKLTVIG